MINVADLKNPKTGKTYRQENSELVHNIPLGTLVELETGARLFVVHLTRDCDMTPLYDLSPYQDDTEQKIDGFRNMKWIGSYPEYSLKVIENG